MSTTKKNWLGYVAVVLALAMVITSAVALGQMNPNASAETVQLSENATVVTSPFTDAITKVKDSVVGVNNYAKSSRNSYYGYGFNFGFGDDRGSSRDDDESTSREVLQTSGSGVVIANGYVLTNFHVVDNASSLEITSGDKTYTATLAGYDESIDLAVLKVDSLDIAPVVIGDSDVLNVGDWAICIGNPLSFTGTTTVGVISALNREVTSSTYDAYGRRSNVVNNMIQTDAAINAGNSGGGMFNTAGELIGVPSMKYTGSYYSSSTVEGIGMAIPVNVAKPLINEVLSGKTAEDSSSASSDTTVNNDLNATKPRIGVKVTNATNFSSYAVSAGIIPNGVYVSLVESGSPAEKAGMQPGDIVVEVDGAIITSTSEMTDKFAEKQAGDTVAVKVYRSEGITAAKTVDDIKDGAYVDLTVELAILDNIQQ